MATGNLHRNMWVAAALAALATGCATGGAAVFSTEAAMDDALGKMCAPVVLEGASMEEIAAERRIMEVDPVGDSTGQSNRTWMLPTISQTSVTLWEDGSCMVSVGQRGNPDELRAQAIAIMASKGVELIQGATLSAPRNGIRTAYCSSGAYPHFLVVTVPGAESSRQPLVATLNQAKGERPEFCQKN